MLVVVGSTNRSKLSGVEKAYSLFVKDLEVLGVAISSGLPPQPTDLDSTFKGALTRALKSLEIVGNADHGVGVEAGLFTFRGAWFDVHVAAIADRDGKVTYGLSPAFEVPKKFTKDLLDGKATELEELVDSYFSTKNIGEYGGLIKFLTDGHVLRDDLIYHSVLMALIPRLNEGLYFR
ncbi:MAG: inosine/xanthosine triphosphatase [Sulfolobales archaeon]|nr:inosine/xanthosine triphosphatase [Sulfolobales archaeon]MCX8186131.1 inosine/xanthosine triphosphatase [Sulfolobales archaeon]MDW7969426.1 inosine/xanthosine triphosphatase [Sulfolobales archaeon]